MYNSNGAPSYITLVATLIPFTTVGVWTVSIDGTVIDSANKDLVTIINSVKQTHGIYFDAETYAGVYFLRNINNLDHLVEIKYTGDVVINHPFEKLINCEHAIISDEGKTYSIALGGFNAGTVWVYPDSLGITKYVDADKTKLHVFGNSYVLEIDGIKYTDEREFNLESTEYGSLKEIIIQHNLQNIISVQPTPIADDIYSYQLVNIDSIPHTVRYYLDKNKPHGNINTKAGTMTELYQGKVIYCKDDSYTGSPTAGSVNNRIVSENGFSMTLAHAALPSIENNHFYDSVIDTRLETIVTLTGTYGVVNPESYKGELPELSINLIIGDNWYSPDVTLDGDTYTWTQTLSSKTFIGVDHYLVSVSRLNGENGYHVKDIYNKPTIYTQFTKYDQWALQSTISTKDVLSTDIVIPNTFTSEQLDSVVIECGSRSGIEVKNPIMSITDDSVTIHSFVNTWLSHNNTQTPTGTNLVLKRSIGEIGIVHDVANNTYMLSLISNTEVPQPTPLYTLNPFDYAYVAITGLGKAVLEPTMFSSSSAGQCFYIEETDTNLWILRM